MSGCVNDPPYYPSGGRIKSLDDAYVHHRDTSEKIWHAKSRREATNIANFLNAHGNGCHKGLERWLP